MIRRPAPTLLPVQPALRSAAGAVAALLLWLLAAGAGAPPSVTDLEPELAAATAAAEPNAADHAAVSGSESATADPQDTGGIAECLQEPEPDERAPGTGLQAANRQFWPTPTSSELADLGRLRPVRDASRRPQLSRAPPRTGHL